MKNILIHLFLLALLIGCTSVETKVEKASSMMDRFEQDQLSVDSTQWGRLEEILVDLDKDLVENRNRYTVEQIDEINKLKGRYSALKLKRSMRDVKDAISDFSTQFEGFIEEMMEDSVEW